MIANIYIALGYFVRFLELMVLIRCILSWIPMRFNNPFVNFINSVTEPMLFPIRKMVYKSPLGGPGMMLDISPVILMLLLDGIYGIAGQLLMGAGI